MVFDETHSLALLHHIQGFTVVLLVAMKSLLQAGIYFKRKTINSTIKAMDKLHGSYLFILNNKSEYVAAFSMSSWMRSEQLLKKSCGQSNSFLCRAC